MTLSNDYIDIINTNNVLLFLEKYEELSLFVLHD